MKKIKNKTLWLSVVATVLIMGMLAYLLSTTGFWGLVVWEKSYRAYYLIGVAAGLFTLVLGIALYRFKKLRIISFVYSCLAILIAIAGTAVLVSLSLGAPDDEVQLCIFPSRVPMLSEDKNLNIALVTDPHWGSSSQDNERLCNMLSDIEEKEFDIVMMGGDIVEYGFVRSQFEQAVADMERTIPTTPLHFFLGNHDVLVNTEKVFMRYFMPEEESPNHVLELAPGVHYVCFTLLYGDDALSRADLEWLDEVLSHYDREDTVIVQAHGFVYASGSLSEGGGEWWDIPALEEKLVPILERNHVDLFVSGHQHSGELMEKNGVHYALIPTAGKTPRQKIEVATKANSIYFTGKNAGYATLAIGQSSLIISYMDTDSNPLFQYEIRTN